MNYILVLKIFVMKIEDNFYVNFDFKETYFCCKYIDQITTRESNVALSELFLKGFSSVGFLG